MMKPQIELAGGNCHEADACGDQPANLKILVSPPKLEATGSNRVGRAISQVLRDIAANGTQAPH
jgi:hypothetical protein